jgi:hypothetical protein
VSNLKADIIQSGVEIERTAPGEFLIIHQKQRRMGIKFLPTGQWQITTPNEKTLIGDALKMMTILKGHCGLDTAIAPVLATVIDLEMQARKDSEFV